MVIIDNFIESCLLIYVLNFCVEDGLVVVDELNGFAVLENLGRNVRGSYSGRILIGEQRSLN